VPGSQAAHAALPLNMDEDKLFADLPEIL